MSKVYEHYESFNVRFNKNKPDDLKRFNAVITMMDKGDFKDFTTWVKAVIDDLQSKGVTPKKKSTNESLLLTLSRLENKLDQALSGGLITKEVRQQTGGKLDEIRKSELTDDFVKFITSDDE